MLKKSIRMKDLEKIKEEILQVLAGETVLDWPGFEKVWPDGKMLVTDALAKYFKIGGEECFPFGQETTLSHFRVLKVIEEIFDYFVDYGSFKAEVLSYKKFVQAFIGIEGIFYRYTELIDMDSDDAADEKDTGHETGISY